MKRYLSAALAALAAVSLSVFAKDEIARNVAKSSPTKSKEIVTAPAKAKSAKSPANARTKLDRKSPSQDAGERPKRELNVAEANRMAALAASVGNGPIFVQAVATGVSQEVSKLAPIDPVRLTRSRFFPKKTEPGVDGGKGQGRPPVEADGRDDERIKNYNPFAQVGPDAALQTWRAPLVMPPPVANFEGLLFSDNGGPLFTPPDPNGAVGPNHYVQTINIVARVFDKTTGAPLTPAFFQSSLFASTPTSPCALNDDGDPIAQYDKLADRWVISQFAISVAPSHQCIAVSQTGDPTGAWYTYDFVLPGTVGATTEPYFADYPHLGTWPDGYYMTTNQFNQAGTQFHSAGFFSFDRAKMLLGDPTAGLLYFDTRKPPFVAAEGIGGVLPSDFDGRVAPPVGAPNLFMYFTTTQFGDPATGMRIFAFHSDFATPANTTLTELTTYAAPLPLAAFGVDTTGARNLIPQPPPATPATFLDAISDRLMHRLQYRNFGAYDSWVVAHNVDADTGTAGFQGGVRTYQIRRTPAGSGVFTVPEQSTFTNGNDGIARWMASAAMDSAGDLAVGYSASSLSVFPSLRYAGRLAGDPPNSLAQGEAVLFAGLGSQTTSGSRWGDYSALQVDPVDDCTFWYTNEYYANNTSANWHTRIGSFKFPSCATPPQGTLSGVVSNSVTAAPIAGATVTLNNGFSATTNATGNYSFTTLPPGPYTATASKVGFSTSAPANVTVNNAAVTTQNFALVPAALFAIGTVTAVDGVPGNANGFLEPGEQGLLTIQLNNVGGGNGTAISGTLSTSTPGVTVTPPANRAYPNINGGSNGSNAAPFQIVLAAGYPCGQPIAMTLTVTFTGGVSPQVLNFNVSTGIPTNFAITTTLDAAPPAGGTTGTQTGRLNRFTPESTCAAPDANPGLFSAVGARQYDAYVFPNPTGAGACVSVSVTQNTGAVAGLFSVAYGAGGFLPATPNTNRIADAGTSAGTVPGTTPYSFVAPVGPFAIVVHETNPAGGIGASYTLTASYSTCAPPPVPLLVYTSTAIAGGNGNAQIDRDECNNLTVTVTNNGGGAATAVSGTLSTATPGVSVFGAATQPFSNIAAAGGTGANTVPFQLSTSPAFVAGTTVNLTLTLNYTGGGSPTILNFSIPTTGGAYTQATGAVAIAPGTALVAGSQADDAMATIALPFTYNFYGTSFNSVNADTNGNLQFTSNASSFSNAALPTATLTDAILPFWDDLDLQNVAACQNVQVPIGPCGIFTSTTGVAPNRIFNIEWRGIRFLGTTRVNFEARLYEGQGNVDLVYNNDVAGASGNGSSATIGIQKGTGPTFTQFSFNTASVLPAPFSVTYTYVPPPPGPGACGAVGGGGGGNNPTSTIISSSLNPSIVGQAVTFKARVVSQATGTPSGNVQFRDGATVLATVPLNLLGEATTTTSALTVGSHTITAFYFGDSNFLQSLSALLTQVVSPLPTTTTAVTSSKNPSNAGDGVTFTATVTSAGGTPTGTVTFFDGAVSLGTGTLSGGKATLATSTLAAGTHSITASYGGSSGFASSTSAALSQVVNAVGNSTTLTSSKNPSLVGDSVTFTATVTAAPPASGTPTGTVTFKDGSTTVGTGTLAAGVATFTTSALALGDHNMTAVYGGDAIFSTTTSATLVQRVTNNAGCTAAGNNLCVQNGRFTIGVAWQNQYAGTSGVGSPIAITPDSGYFTFFSPNNIELLVKVLDGRSVNGNFWVLYGALSDVAYTITVTDTTTSTVKTYKNPAGTLASFSDTTAFPSARAAGAMTVTGDEYGQLASIQWAETLAKGFEPKSSGRQALAGACTTSGGTLCIQGGRFSVSVAWKNYNDGATGSGTAVSLASDSGSFWFFNSSNIELLVKVLDGTSVNGKFWFGYGALSDVEYTITVTDTNTGAVKTYNNPAHNLGSKLDLNAF